jgi:drug/metabolite transporter (DMT)-like permease
MTDLWIPITIAGAFLQNARSALQKHLAGRLTTLGATYVRFIYALPFAILYVAGLHYWGGMPLPQPNGLFVVYTLLGGFTQITFTFFLIWLFSFRNFAVGTTYSKTEVLQIAVLGYFILGDTLTAMTGLAVAVAVLGVLVLSAGQTKITAATLLTSLTEKPTLIGLASGAFLGASVVFFRGAGLSLAYEGSFVMVGAYALACALIVQTVGMGLFLFVRERRTLIDVFVQWRWSLTTGIVGVLTSMCWFTAFVLENAAYIRALGQVELIFTFAASVFFFHERTSRVEILGILLVVIGIVILILGR